MTASLDLKTIATVCTLLATLLGVGSAAGVALYRVDELEEEVTSHVSLLGHGPLSARVDGQGEGLVDLKERITKLQASVSRNERNQIRICVAVGANCEN